MRETTNEKKSEGKLGGGGRSWALTIGGSLKGHARAPLLGKSGKIPVGGKA